ncbi:MAG TPA: hypothetical protein VL197_10685 [Nitrospirota bacterium]|nr:hypothetical protein [Nitrospirota bacterium]
MKQKRGSRMAFALLGAMLVAAALNGCGSSTENRPPASGTVLSASTPTAGIDVCAGCHTDTAADWLSTTHANLNPAGDLGSPGSPTLGQIGTCTKNCHNPNGDSARVALAGSLGTTARPVVGCEACHGPGSLHANAGGVQPISLLSNTTGTVLGSGPTVTLSGQFVMCTYCHELLNSTGTGTVVAAHDAGGAEAASASGNNLIITDTHFATALTSFGSITPTGYAMDFSRETVCTDCHNPHKNSDIAISNEWAESAHASRAPSEAWSRTNWSRSPTCQRCHTTTGYAQYADALASGNAVQAKAILYGTLATFPVPSAASWKPELLECTGCHSDNKGALRNPGPYTADYSYSFYVTPPAVATISSVASFAYPDLAGSNICMPCHTGRQNGDSIKNMNVGAVVPVDFTNRTIIDGHHFMVGAVMFRTAGYNYSGRDYTNIARYLHDKIGTAGAPDTGTNGPCVGCHMSRPNGVGDHLFFPAAFDDNQTVISSITGSITSIPSEVCSKCHGLNDSSFVAMINNEKNLFANAQSALQKVLDQAGFYQRTGSNTFYRARNLSLITAGTVTAVTGSAVITGIKTNWTALSLDPGDQFRIDSDGAWYPIASVDLATQITLSTPYTGATFTSASGVSYTIRRNETVSVTYSSPIVTGTNTNWTSLIATGDKFRVDKNGVWYSIASVDSDTQITLTTNYLGASTTTSGFSLQNNATASVTSASATVTITGANPLTLDVGLPGSGTTGDYFRLDSDGTWYKINNRDATTLTLSSVYTGASATGAFTIIRSSANNNWLFRGDTDITGNTTGKNTMGAAVNLVVFSSTEEPGAFVHNRYYAKRLIYDSIDWLDDGVLNYSAGATLTAICAPGPGRPAWCDGAMTYLLPNGVIGISAERP